MCTEHPSPELLRPEESERLTALLRRTADIPLLVTRTGKVRVDLLGVTRPRLAASCERVEAFLRTSTDATERRLAEALASTLRALR